MTPTDWAARVRNFGSLLVTAPNHPFILNLHVGEKYYDPSPKNGCYESMFDTINPICNPWCWNIYLQSWVIFGVNEGNCRSIFQHHGLHPGMTSVPYPAMAPRSTLSEMDKVVRGPGEPEKPWKTNKKPMGFPELLAEVGKPRRCFLMQYLGQRTTPMEISNQIKSI